MSNDHNHISLGIGVGILQFFQGDDERISNVIPVDLCVNFLLTTIPFIYNQVY